jgi:hypothetical protein
MVSPAFLAFKAGRVALGLVVGARRREGSHNLLLPFFFVRLFSLSLSFTTIFFFRRRAEIEAARVFRFFFSPPFFSFVRSRTDDVERRLTARAQRAGHEKEEEEKNDYFLFFSVGSLLLLL